MKSVLIGLLLIYDVQANNTSCPQFCTCVEKGHTAYCSHDNLTTVDIGLPSWIKYLTLSYNSISRLQNYVFLNTSLTGVEYLVLSNNSLTYVGKYAFEGMKSLDTLELSYNNISHLDPETFSSTIKLTTLYLKNNPLIILNHGFLKSPSINEMVLESCNISYISPRAFEGMLKLRRLDLQNNKLTRVEPITFILISELYMLYFSGNPWICAPEFYIFIRSLEIKRVYHSSAQCTDGTINSTAAVNSTIPDSELNQMYDSGLKRNTSNSSDKVCGNVDPLTNHTIPALIIGASIIACVLIVISYKHYSSNQIKVRRFNSTSNSYPNTTSSDLQAQLLVDG